MADNFGFNSDLAELEECVEKVKQVDSVMARMGDFKLKKMVLRLEEKLGLANRNLKQESSINQLVAELSAEKKRNQRQSSQKRLSKQDKSIVMNHNSSVTLTNPDSSSILVADMKEPLKHCDSDGSFET